MEAKTKRAFAKANRMLVFLYLAFLEYYQKYVNLQKLLKWNQIKLE